jgi:predicted RNA binding protein YcfA (HicA-like mRNA interferase family)
MNCVFVCRMRIMKSAEILKRLRNDGWYLVHIVGSHHQMRHPTKLGKVTVPHPKKDLPLPTVRSIFKQAGLTP